MLEKRQIIYIDGHYSHKIKTEDSFVIVAAGTDEEGNLLFHNSKTFKISYSKFNSLCCLHKCRSNWSQIHKSDRQIVAEFFALWCAVNWISNTENTTKEKSSFCIMSDSFQVVSKKFEEPFKSLTMANTFRRMSNCLYSMNEDKINIKIEKSKGGSKNKADKYARQIENKINNQNTLREKIIYEDKYWELRAEETLIEIERDRILFKKKGHNIAEIFYYRDELYFELKASGIIEEADWESKARILRYWLKKKNTKLIPRQKRLKKRFLKINSQVCLI